MASIVFVSFLFGVLHLLQALGASSLQSALVVSLASFISALWWGAIVSLWASVWPAVVLHAVSNAAVLVKLLAEPGMMLADSAFLLAGLFELPLVILFLGLLWRSAPLPQPAETPHFSTEP